MGNCASDERPGNTVGTAPVAHHPGAYPGYQAPPPAVPQSQPYLPPAHATPASYPSGPQHTAPSAPSAYGTSQPAPVAYPSQYPPQPYSSQPSPLPGSQMPTMSGPYQQPMVAQPPYSQSAAVPLQPYSRTNNSRAAMGQVPAQAGVVPTATSRMQELSRMFPNADQSVIQLAIEHSPDRTQQERHLTTLTGEQPRASNSLASRAPMETTASLMNQRAVFRVGQPIDGMYEGSYHPGTIQQIHANPSQLDGSMQFQYTVEWLEDKTISLLNEHELRGRL